MLDDLGNDLLRRQRSDLACQCFVTAIKNSTSSGEVPKHLQYKLKVCAREGLVARTFQETALFFREMTQILGLTDEKLGLTDENQDLHLAMEAPKYFAEQFVQLFELLAQTDKKLNLQCITMLMEVLELDNTRIGYAKGLLPAIFELIEKRVAQIHWTGVLNQLWNPAFLHPVDTTPIQLAAFTEELLGETSERCLEFYKKGAAEMVAQGYSSEASLLWKTLTDARESSEGKNCPSILPLLAEHARHLYKNQKHADCLEIIDHAKEVDLSAWNLQTAELLPLRVGALLSLSETHAQLKNESNETPLFSDNLKQIVRDTAMSTETHRKICDVLFDFAEHLRRENKNQRTEIIAMVSDLLRVE